MSEGANERWCEIGAGVEYNLLQIYYEIMCVDRALMKSVS